MQQAAIEVGSVVGGDYRIERSLSSGGMGTVYVAEQTSTGKRRALKLMRPELVADERSRRRFVEEARASSRIDSAHVVEVIAAGVDEGTGLPWIAMELLSGRDLATHVAENGPLGLGEAAVLFAQLGHALGRAHALGVVHRDLKPENLFLAEDQRAGGSALLKVLDFGIATYIANDKAAATVTSAIGSPLWLAPEQMNTGAQVRAATDVWALGLIGFFLLTGRSYWPAASVEPFNLHALLAEIVTGPLAPASERCRQLGLGPLPAGFDEWFARCVDRDPSARFPDGAAAADAFARFAAAASPTPAPHGSGVAPTALLRGVPPTAVLSAAPPTAAHGGAPPTVALGGALPTAALGPSQASETAASPRRPRRAARWALALGAFLVLAGGGAALWVAGRDGGAGSTDGGAGSTNDGASRPVAGARPAPPQAELLATLGVSHQLFELALSGDGRYLLVGGSSQSGEGGATMYARSSSAWAPVELVTSAYVVDVALDGSGSRALVAVATFEPDGAHVLVLVRRGDRWVEEDALRPEPGAWCHSFGRSIALSADGSRALVSTEVCGAHVFVRSGSRWSEEARLEGPPLEGERFGHPVALSANGARALVASQGADERRGAVAVFARAGSAWTPEATLRDESSSPGTLFGGGLALDAEGERALVGLAWDDHARGSARVYARVDGSWREEARLRASAGSGGDQVARVVAFDGAGTRALLSAHGYASVFVRSRTGWSESPVPGLAGYPSGYGVRVALDARGETGVVGEAREPAGGSVHVYRF